MNLTPSDKFVDDVWGGINRYPKKRCYGSSSGSCKVDNIPKVQKVE